MRICTYPGCDRRRLSREYCFGHHERKVRGLPMDKPFRRKLPAPELKPPCAATACYKPARNEGLCYAHHRRKHVDGRLDWDRPIQKRGPRGKGRSKVQVNANVRPEVELALRKQAASNGYTRTAWVAILMEQAVAEMLKPREEAA